MCCRCAVVARVCVSGGRRYCTVRYDTTNQSTHFVAVSRRDLAHRWSTPSDARVGACRTPDRVSRLRAHQTHTSSLPSNMLVVLLASTALLSPLRNFAINQAQAAASTIVDTNQVISFNANPETLCETVECNPTRRALEIQKRKIIPPRARNRIAKVRLWSAKRLLSVTDRWARKRPPPQPSREEEETDQS